MPKFGSAVLLVLGVGGKTRALEALVLREHNHAPRGANGEYVKVNGVQAPPEIHLDVAYVDPDLENVPLKSNQLEAILRPAYDVPAFKDGAQRGWKLAVPAGVKSFAAQLSPKAAAWFEDGTNAQAAALALESEVDFGLEEEPDEAPAAPEVDPLENQLTDAEVEAAKAASIASIADPNAGVGNQALAQRNADPGSFETKQYADGSSASGTGPLPDKSPDEQAAEEAQALPSAADLDAVEAEKAIADAHDDFFTEDKGQAAPEGSAPEGSAAPTE